MRTAFDTFADALEAAGLEVVDRDLDQGPCVTVADGDASVFFELARRSPSSPCYTRTERFDVSARPLVRGDRMTASERAIAERAIEVLRAWERELALPAREEAERGSEVREVEVERALVAECEGRYYLNPYVGCSIGCPFCWVADRADLGRALTGRAAVPWGRWVDVKVNLPAIVREEVRRLTPGPVRMSPVVTDPYQPLERRYRVSRRCIEALLEARFVPIVLTRARLVLEDLPLLAAHPEHVAVGVSIPTDDDGVRRAFEPRADPIDARLTTLRALKAAGIVTFAVIQPVLPMDAERLVAAIAPHVDAVRLDRMHESARALPLYERAGRLDAADPRFAEDTLTRLHAGFTTAGVPIDTRDDLASMVLEVLAKRRPS